MQCSALFRSGLRRVGAPTAGSLSMIAGAACLASQYRFASSKNPYTVLGVKQSANKNEIKKAYRVLARKWHPDAPGGDGDKFREIQEAYEQVKTGVWIKKGGDGESSSSEGGGGGGNTNRYSNFRYTTRAHSKSKVSYDEFYTEMHTGKVKKDPFADDEEDEAAEAARKDPRRNPFAMNELLFQAWLRFIIMWCVIFTVFRIGLFLMYPPQWEKPQRKQLPRELRKKPPPPKPLTPRENDLVA